MTPPRRRRTRAEQQAETRARLVEAAAEVFAAHGFEGASIDLITERAGYTRGAFYSNFSDKAELLLELMRDRMREFTGVLPGILAASEEDRIGEAARWLVEQPPPVEVLLLVELARLRHDHGDVAALLDEMADRSLGFVGDVLDEADEPTVPCHDRTGLERAVLAAVLGAQLLRHVGIDVDPRTMELLLSGVLHSPVLPDTSDAGAR
ncbi:TetR/AcrR family transcriptional regulator [Egicoccus sp. AB-alg2]|uniref:TetR/AcrR family transcriptional regulator n=1 Tax=Egicoccus sp. AB-alg2 TaxID=3242693 RepID=UPI00359F1239